MSELDPSLHRTVHSVSKEWTGDRDELKERIEEPNPAGLIIREAATELAREEEHYIFKAFAEIGINPLVVVQQEALINELKSQQLAVLELHKEQVRYYLDESGDMSWDSSDDVIAYYGDDEVSIEQVKTFSVCAECARLEINLAKLGDYDYAYESSHYPCRTRQAIKEAVM